MSDGGHRVSVLIVNWNTMDLLDNCLRRLHSLSEADDLEIVVVDNGSKDESVDMVRRSFPLVTLIANQYNAGFARANNQAFKVSTQPTVLLLNSDTEVADGAIARCRDYLAANADVGAVGCRIEDPDGSSQNSVFRFPSLRGVASTTFWLAQAFPDSRVLNHDRYGHIDPDRPTNVEVVMGSFLMTRRADLGAEILDDGYFMYAEEADLCRRLMANDLKVMFLPEVSVMHVKGASSRTPMQLAWSDEAKKRAVLRFLAKWDGVPVAYLTNLLMLAGMGPRIVLWLAADGINRASGRDSRFRYKIRALGFHLSAIVRPSKLSERFHGPPSEVADTKLLPR